MFTALFLFLCMKRIPEVVGILQSTVTQDGEKMVAYQSTVKWKSLLNLSYFLMPFGHCFRMHHSTILFSTFFI